MGVISKVISSELDKAKRRIIKVLGKGKNDVRTPFHTSSPNTDSPPIASMRAIYMPTSTKGKSVIVGYINENLVAEPGEYRIKSTDSDGNEKNYVWLKGDGTIEIGGKNDNMVRYSKLDLGLKNQDSQIQAELVKIQAGITAAGGTYTPGSIATDISASKINKVKTSNE